MTWRLYFFVANPVSGTCGRIFQMSPRHSGCRQNLNYMICSTFYKSIYGLPHQRTGIASLSCLFTKSHQRKLSFQRISRAFRAVLGRFCGFRTRKNSWFSRPEVPVRALRRFQNSNFRRFQTLVFVLKTCLFPAVRASLSRDKGLTGVQRRPCCNAVRAPLRPRKALTARRQRFRRFPAARLWSVCDYE